MSDKSLEVFMTELFNSVHDLSNIDIIALYLEQQF